MHQLRSIVIKTAQVGKRRSMGATLEFGGVLGVRMNISRQVGVVSLEITSVYWLLVVCCR